VPTALIGGTVIDGQGGPARPGTTVVIDGSTVAEVSEARQFGSEVDVLDVTGKSIMPGIIDTHMHFSHWGLNLIAYQGSSLMLLAAETAHALRLTVEAGCTTARDLGGLDPGFREAVARGLIPGPRLKTSITVVSPTNGIVDATTAQGLASPLPPGMPNGVCDGPAEARARVREVLRAGADVIKIATTGGVSSAKIDPRRQIFSREEVEAIVDEAHMAGIQVCCHALGGPGLLMAVKAGVDTIEHGGWIDEEAADEMAARGTWYIPTFAVYRWHGTLGPAFKQQRAQAMWPAHRESFALARRKGVRIAMGTDGGGYGYGENAIELELLVEHGMTPAEAIEASTRLAAQCMGMQADVGTLEAGKQADLLVVDGDPLSDITVLRKRERLSLVMQAGKVVAGQTAPTRALAGAGAH
jgi:imidazolonepropionase-like amidohydrolase